MSRSGYRKLEQALMVENDRSKQGTLSENVETGVTSPPSPPFRHVKWKRVELKIRVHQVLSNPGLSSKKL